MHNTRQISREKSEKKKQSGERNGYFPLPASGRETHRSLSSLSNPRDK